MSTTHFEQTIQVVVNLSADDRARLDKILEALTGLQPPNCHSCAEAAEPKPVDLPTPVEEPETPKYDQADILALVQKLAAPTSTKREQAKAIVKEYAVKVSAIPADKYNEVMDKLTALDKQEA